MDPGLLKSRAGRRELSKIAERHYRVTRDAIRRYDPNHLILADAAGHIRAPGDTSWPPTADRTQDGDHYRKTMETLWGIPQSVGYHLCGAYTPPRPDGTWTAPALPTCLTSRCPHSSIMMCERL